MLTSVHIYDFRSCKNIVIEDIPSMLALIGRNGAGKSNVLMAIDWAARKATAPEGQIFDPDEFGFRSKAKVSLTFELGEQKYVYLADRTSTFDVTEPKRPAQKVVLKEELSEIVAGTFRSIVKRDQGTVKILLNQSVEEISTLEIAEEAPLLPTLKSILPASHSFQPLMLKILNFLTSIKYYSLQDETSSEKYYGAIPGDEYLTWLAKKSNADTSVESLLFKLIHLSNEKQDIFDEIGALLGENGLNLIQKIEVENIGRSQKGAAKYYLLNFCTSTLDKHLTYNQLSFGTRRLLLLLVSLFYDASSVSLIEQPEDGIHFGLLKKLIPMLRSYADERQFLIASHSSPVLNQLKPNEVRIVEIADGVTSVKALSQVEIDAARNYLEKDGSFAEFLESI